MNDTTKRAQSMIHDAGSKANARIDQAATSVGSALEAGADKLNRGSEIVTNKVTDAADYFRHSDARSMTHDLTSVVRSHPGKSVLVGLGVGYLISRMFRS